MKTLGLIPARAGSKRIQNKNLALLANRPLLNYTVEASLRSKRLSRVVVSSDSTKILDIAQKAGSETLIRPENLATDTASSADVLEHALAEELKQGRKYDYALLLQPTSPLRHEKHIDDAYDLFLKARVDSLISVREFGYQPFKCFVQNANGFLSGLVDNESPFKRRQDLQRTYLSNGAIYIVQVESFLKTKTFLIEPCLPYVMDHNSSLEVDEPEDMDKIERILRGLD